MKKLLSNFLIASLVLTASIVPTAKAEAQTSLISSDNGTVLDTISSAGTEYLTLSSQISSSYKTATFSLTVTKISGTVAGTATLQGSLDGTLWYTEPGTSAYTITDGTQTTAFKVAYPYGSRYQRVAVTNATGSFSYKGKVVARK